MSDTMNVDTQNGFPTQNRTPSGRPSGNGPKCHSCGQTGHRKQQCPNRGNANQGNGQNQGSQGNNGRQNSQQNNSRRGSKINGNHSQPNQHQTHGQARAQLHCDNCPGKTNHTTETCKKGRTGQNNTAQQQNHGQARAPLHCDNCPGKTNHTTETCKKGANTNNNKFNAAKPNLPRHGYVHEEPFKWTSKSQPHGVSTPYCPGCNTTSHAAHECRDDSAPYRLSRSPWVCVNCSVRGHTKDDCQNPAVANKCSNCRKPGHSATECRANHAGVADIFHSESDKTSQRFKWNLPANWALGPGQLARIQLAEVERAAQQTGCFLQADHMREALRRIQAEEASLSNWGFYTAPPSTEEKPQYFWLNSPGPHSSTSSQTSTPSYSPCQTPGSSSIPEAQLTARDREIRAHYERSACLYHKYHLNASFWKHEAALRGLNAREVRILSDDELLVAKKLAMQDANFWRDPRAMEALARGQKARCRCCGGVGKFLDARMREVVPGEDVLAVGDWEEWGLSVFFTCKCCNQGFDYVFDTSVHEEGVMEGMEQWRYV